MREPRPRKSRPWPGTVLAIAAGTLGVTGLVIRLSVRDSLPATAVVFYATPWPVLAAMLVLLAGGLRLRNRSRWTCPVATVGLVLLAAWMLPTRPSGAAVGLEPADTFTCLTWNTDHGQSGWPQVAETIHSQPADLVCLVEAGPAEPKHEQFWTAAFPDHASGTLGSGMLVLVRDGTIHQARAGSLDNKARYRQFDVCCRGQSLVLLVVDVKSTPWVSRQSALEQLAELVCTFEDRPVLITGDFNTPTDSAWFDTWRPALKNGWEEAGRGFGPTWPVPLSVLDLDQCWGNRHVVFVDCHTARTSRSDHRQLLTRFAIIPQQ